ncbi:MAG: hypothetical protein ACKOLA_10575 [Spartobacteria bacterium]
MDDINEAAALLGVDAKFLQPFEAADPFHGDLPLEGFLCQRPDHRYGALALLRVGGHRAPQVVYATPKLHYPFGKDGRFHFPPISTAHIHEKLDGTNVLAYHYTDAEGHRRLTYKLRLSPVLRNSKWGPFLDYWRELIARHPDLPGLAQANGCHISFEMYGARNTHLIAYEEPLAAAVLFGIDPKTAAPVPPSRLNAGSVPTAPLLAELQANDDPVARFAALRQEIENGNRPASDGKILGSEGAVWFVTEPGGRTTLWKCKPESVEAIHWAAGINKAAVIATCWNALETADELSYETLLPLLLEEYQADDIEKFRTNIDEAIAHVRAEQEFRSRVRAAYGELTAAGLSLPDDKSAVMRALSTKFRREEMGRVYAAIAHSPA